MYGDTFLFFDLYKILKYSFKNENKTIITIYKNKDIKYFNNIYYNQDILEMNNSRFKSRNNYIDYGLIYFDKNYFNINKNIFDIDTILKNILKEKKIITFKIKKKFLEIGSFHGYKKTNNNFKKIKNEIH